MIKVQKYTMNVRFISVTRINAKKYKAVYDDYLQPAHWFQFSEIIMKDTCLNISIDFFHLVSLGMPRMEKMREDVRNGRIREQLS